MPTKKKTKKKNTLKLISVRRLREVAAQIMREPLRYNQHSTGRPDCGAPACLLGWAIHLFGGDARVYQVAEGARVLRITHLQAGRLYRPGLWPEAFRSDYSVAKHHRYDFTAACVAVARIEHFIRTNGAE